MKDDEKWLYEMTWTEKIWDEMRWEMMRHDGNRYDVRGNETKSHGWVKIRSRSSETKWWNEKPWVINDEKGWKMIRSRPPGGGNAQAWAELPQTPKTTLLKQRQLQLATVCFFEYLRRGAAKGRWGHISQQFFALILFQYRTFPSP